MSDYDAVMQIGRAMVMIGGMLGALAWLIVLWDNRNVISVGLGIVAVVCMAYGWLVGFP